MHRNFTFSFLVIGVQDSKRPLHHPPLVVTDKFFRVRTSHGGGAAFRVHLIRTQPKV